MHLQGVDVRLPPEQLRELRRQQPADHERHQQRRHCGGATQAHAQARVRRRRPAPGGLWAVGCGGVGARWVRGGPPAPNSKSSGRVHQGAPSPRSDRASTQKNPWNPLPTWRREKPGWWSGIPAVSIWCTRRVRDTWSVNSCPYWSHTHAQWYCGEEIWGREAGRMRGERPRASSIGELLLDEREGGLTRIWVDPPGVQCVRGQTPHGHPLRSAPARKGTRRWRTRGRGGRRGGCTDRRRRQPRGSGGRGPWCTRRTPGGHGGHDRGVSWGVRGVGAGVGGGAQGEGGAARREGQGAAGAGGRDGMALALQWWALGGLWASQWRQ